MTMGQWLRQAFDSGRLRPVRVMLLLVSTLCTVALLAGCGEGSGKGANGTNIVIGRPYQGPSGGRVLALSDARKDATLRNSPCVKAPG